MSHELVSVVVPAMNEAAEIGACLGSVLAQTHQALEVIVVDGGSHDGTREIVGDLATRDRRVRLLQAEGASIPAALNAGLRAARGTWLVRVDAHSTVPPDYVARAVTHLREGWGGVGGRKDGVGRTDAGRAIAAAMASPFGVGGSRYHHATSAQATDHIPFGAYPVRLLRELGGWDERLRVNEDFALDQRVLASGRRLLLDPAMRIEWVCRQRVRDLYRQYRRYGRGKPLVMRLHPRSTKPRHLAPPALVAALALSVIALPWTLLPLTALGAAYAVVLSGATVMTMRGPAGRDLPRAAWPSLLAAFVAMHLGWGLGFWAGVPAALPPRAPRRHAPRERVA